MKDPVAWAIVPKFIDEGVVRLYNGRNVFSDEHQACMGASFAREDVVPLYFLESQALQFWKEDGTTKYDEVYYHLAGIDEEGEEHWTLH